MERLQSGPRNLLGRFGSQLGGPLIQLDGLQIQLERLQSLLILRGPQIQRKEPQNHLKGPLGDRQIKTEIKTNEKKNKSQKTAQGQ